MKRKGILLLIILALGVALFSFIFGGKVEQPAKKKAAIGLSAPDFELKDINGKMWRLADLRGKVVLVTFWATWCDSCKEENPALRNSWILKRKIVIWLSLPYCGTIQLKMRWNT